MSSFSPSSVDLPSAQIIAPFFADVDTRGENSGLMTYGRGTVQGKKSFGVSWIDVGYFPLEDDKLNTFQLVLVDRSDIAPGDFDIEFNYQKIQWETGGASDGINGLGGDSARAGYSNGNETDFEEIEGSSVPGSFLDGGPNELRSLTNVNDPGRYVVLVRGGDIVYRVPVTDVEVASLKNGLEFFSSLMTRDLNRRLLRLRSGNELHQFRSEGYDSEQVRRNDEGEIMFLEEPGMVLDWDVIGSYDFHRRTVDAHKLPNASGVLISSVPQLELKMEVASAGVEVGLNDWLRLGLVGLFGKGEFDQSGGGFDGDFDSVGLAGYASAYFKDALKEADFYVDFMFAHSDGEVSTRRSVLDHYNVGVMGQSDYDSQNFEFNTGLVFEDRNVTHGPYFSYRQSDGQMDSYSESGYEYADVMPALDIESRVWKAGYQVAIKLNSFYPYLSMAYEDELEDEQMKVETLFLGARPSHAIIGEMGVTYNPGFGMQATVGYEYRHFDSDVAGHSVLLNARYEF